MASVSWLIMNNAAVNMSMQLFLENSISSIYISIYIYISEVELLDCMVILFLNFRGTSILFSIVVIPIYISMNGA